jgi:putative acetyltransferase
MSELQVITASRLDYPELITLWEGSVRATHLFLNEADIQRYRELILEQYFDQVKLYCIKQDGVISGFMGIDDDLLQMLFIQADKRGHGLGRALVTFAIRTLAVSEVNVNEQNIQALKFYELMGFETFERYEYDGAGKPYPILAMSLKY